jgi:hypothetical protein
MLTVLSQVEPQDPQRVMDGGKRYVAAAEPATPDLPAHPTPIRYALMACFIHARALEVTKPPQ